MVSKHLILLLLLITEVRVLTIPGAGYDLAQAEDAATRQISILGSDIQTPNVDDFYNALEEFDCLYQAPYMQSSVQ